MLPRKMTSAERLESSAVSILRDHYSCAADVHLAFNRLEECLQTFICGGIRQVANEDLASVRVRTCSTPGSVETYLDSCNGGCGLQNF